VSVTPSLRILVATDQWFPDFTGGSARVAADTARELARRGHEVTVLAPRVASSCVEEIVDGIRLLRVLGRGPLPHSITDVVATARSARAKGRGFDVAVAHQVTTGVGLAFGARSTPLVLVYHASAPREVELRRRASRAKIQSAAKASLAIWLRTLERISVRRAVRVMTLSEYSRSLVLRDADVASAKVVTVSGAVDLNAFARVEDRAVSRRRLGLDDAPLLLAVRRLEPCLGLETVLQAFARLPLSLGAGLAFVGSGPLEGKLRSLSRDLGLDGRVHFVGRATTEELARWYRAADVCVVPPAEHEGFGLAAAEALACGTPVIGAPAGAIPEILRPLDDRLIATDASAEALEEAILRVLAIPAADFGARARAYVSGSFGWTGVVDDWERVLVEAATEAREGLTPHPQAAKADRFELLGAPLDALSLGDAVELIDEAISARRPIRHASVNAAKLVRLRRDPALADALRSCELVTADGQPVVWAARLSGHPVPERVAGIDLMEALLERAELRGHRVFLFGGKPDVLERAVEAVRARHPRLTIAGAQHGYYDRGREAETVARIASSRPDIVLIALGSPEKEIFQAAHGDALGASFVMGVGGAFEILAGVRRRAPGWARAAGLEWLFRLAQDPQRLLGRYAVGNAIFLGLAAREVVRVRLSRIASGMRA
jgi:N-acetylglucosaminyldiphosphoundecaprenol N-acetyl-beta-D-mannosaminyltransferase